MCIKNYKIKKCFLLNTPPQTDIIDNINAMIKLLNNVTRVATLISPFNRDVLFLSSVVPSALSVPSVPSFVLPLSPVSGNPGKFIPIGF